MFLDMLHLEKLFSVNEYLFFRLVFVFCFFAIILECCLILPCLSLGRCRRVTARQTHVTCTGGCGPGVCARWRVAAASSPAAWNASTAGLTRPWLTRTAPGNGGLSPGNTATSHPAAVRSSASSHTHKQTYIHTDTHTPTDTKKKKTHLLTLFSKGHMWQALAVSV